MMQKGNQSMDNDALKKIRLEPIEENALMGAVSDGILLEGQLQSRDMLLGSAGEGMGEDSLLKEKLDPRLYELVREESSDIVKVIIQTLDGLKDDDKKLLEKLGGKIRDNLYIINAFSAEIPLNAIKTLILSPRVKKLYYDAEVRAI